MSDQTFVTPPFIGTFCRWSVGLETRTTSGAPTYASGAWNVANQAVYTTSVNTTRLRMIGVLQEASALPLPSTATPVARTGTMLPHFGITRTASGG
jgi:hypothetical protein